MRHAVDASPDGINDSTTSRDAQYVKRSNQQLSQNHAPPFADFDTPTQFHNKIKADSVAHADKLQQ